MDVQVVTAAICAAVAFALLLQQFLLIAAIKRLLAEERKKNAETMVQALRSLESSFADGMRHLAARIEQVEVGLDAIGRTMGDAPDIDGTVSRPEREGESA